MDTIIEAKPNKAPGGLGLPIERSPRFAVMKGLFNFQALKEFIEDCEGLEAQRRLDSDPDYRDPSLEKIRAAVAEMGKGFGRIRIDRTLPGKPLMVEKNGRFLNLVTQLSEGEAGLIALWCSLAAYGLESGDAGFQLLIDEIDLSLHPLWQAKVVSQISSRWPKAQVIVTSHSPFVWRELEREQIIHLVADADGRIRREKADYAAGGSVDSIINDHFEIEPYSENFKTEVHQVDDLIHGRKFSEAREKMEYLRSRYGDLPVLVKFQTRIRALEG
jgi:hypothetical protein